MFDQSDEWEIWKLKHNVDELELVDLSILLPILQRMEWLPVAAMDST